MTMGFILLIICNFFLSIMIGAYLAYSVVKKKPRQPKRYSFDSPADISFQKSHTSNTKALYDTDIKESVDGANACKEYKKG